MSWSWFPQQFSVLYVLLVIYLIAWVVQLYYYLFVLWRPGRYKTWSVAKSLPPVSVIVCARNEERNLRLHLSAVLDQEYPEFEVIVVNHFSSDGTQDLLEAMKAQYPQLRIIHIREEAGLNLGKKYPLTMGLKGAKYDHVLLTDADCHPVSRQWIKSMCGNFTENTQIVLGYGGYRKEKGLLNKLIRFDTFYIALQYFGFTLSKNPYMGVGRNLAYNKELFFKNKGFGKHYMLPSGDDDLFINKVATWHNTIIEMRRDSHTRSIPKKSWGSWLYQKKRHLTTGRYYRKAHRYHLGMLFVSSWLFVVLFLVLLTFNYAPYVLLPAFVLRILIQLLTFNLSMSKLGERDLLGGAPFYEFVLLIIYPFLALSARISKISKWN